MTKRQKTSLELRALLKKLGVRIVKNKKKGKWPKKLKLKAIDQALILARKRPAQTSEISCDVDAAGNPKISTARFCAIGCLAAVMGRKVVFKEAGFLDGDGDGGFEGNTSNFLRSKTFDGSECNVAQTIDRNDNPVEDVKNSTVDALKWLRKQIEQE